MHDIVFIKAGGSGNIIKSESIPNDYTWLIYRQLCIDHKYFKTLIKHVGLSSRKQKIGLAVGGVGAYLFTDFAKQIGLKNRTSIHKFGSNIVNTTASIILSSFKHRKINVYPELVEVGNSLESKFETYDLILLKASSKYYSTDSLVADAASRISKSRLIFFKANILDRTNNSNSTLTIDHLKTLSLKNEVSLYFDPLIDLYALNMIEKHFINTIICEKELIGNLENIIDFNSNFQGLFKLSK
jgi:uridylate kinase